MWFNILILVCVTSLALGHWQPLHRSGLCRTSLALAHWQSLHSLSYIILKTVGYAFSFTLKMRFIIRAKWNDISNVLVLSSYHMLSSEKSFFFFFFKQK